MKYQRAAIILATTAVLSIYPLGRSDALDTTKHNGGVSKPPISSPIMYGYCIGCVALMAHTSGNTEPSSTKTVSSSIEMVKTKQSSRRSVGLDHSTSAKKLLLPSSTNTPPSSGEHHTPHNATGHRLQSLVNLHHQLNLIMISRSMHNKQELFLQDLIALSLFLVAVAIGFAWSNNNKDEEEHGDGCTSTSAERNKFDLISKRLLSDDFNGIGLTPTDDEEEDVQEQEVKKDVTQDASLLPPVVGSNTAEPQWTLRYRGEWEPLHPINAEDEQNAIEKEQVIILTKPIRNNNAKIIKSILTGSASNTSECSSALKVTKRVSFQEDVAQDEEEVTSVSSVTKKSRKGLWLKLSLANLCEMKSRE
ncbi:hypothetical protein QTG54_015037 [Skeletonema marinoi]|uniref:Uncharacterized protein n=1 Tax=Skeletonema marinoi TaxID=267567 RepID=A0AAD8XVI7_9STRA|nr:hypothetical protein QTG54_015037 [Skeletonema marinoi]